MKTSNKGIELIKSFEGCHLTSYKCPSSVWTIGYGHTAGTCGGMVITQAKAEEYLKSDLAKFEKYVTNTGLKLNQNQFDALVSFTYNCGHGNLKKLINGRTLAQIADAILLYNKSRGKVLSGLVRRRQSERALFLTEVEEVSEVSYNMVKMVDYKQNDKRWGDLPYAVDGEKSTIKSAGCGPTALANVLAAIVSPYIDPVTLASWARQHDYKVKASGTSYNFFAACARAYGVTVRRLNTSNIYGNSNSPYHAQVLAELQAGNWVIACMGKGLWTSSGHYVTVYGYEAGMVYINDPASAKESRACNTWDYFKKQVKYYWVVEVPENIKRNGIVKDGAYQHSDFVREVQFCTGATPDGIAGPQTLSKTVTVSASKNRKHAVVYVLQKFFKKLGYYTAGLDRIAGQGFTNAVHRYQAVNLNYRCTDGEITKRGKMWKSLLKV